MISQDIEREYFDLAVKAPIRRLFQRRGVAVSDLIDAIQKAVNDAEKVTPHGTPPPCRDEKDRKYLHCAFSANVRWLVTRDDDLLEAPNQAQTSVLRPEDFIASAETSGLALVP